MANKTIIKYSAFNVITLEHYLCTSKKLLAKHIGTSVDTIRRRMATPKGFSINSWHISIDVEVHKQPKRNTNSFG